MLIELRILAISTTDMSPSGRSVPRSLAANLVRTVLAIYLSLALLLTIGQLVLEYDNEKHRLTKEIESVAKTFNPIISKALWNVDEEQTQASLHGVLGINYDVLNAQLLDTEGRVLYDFYSDAHKNPRFTDWPVIRQLTAWFLEEYRFEYDLYYASDFTAEHKIGELVLQSNSNVVFNRAAHTFLITIISAIFKTTLLAMIFLLDYALHGRAPTEADHQRHAEPSPKRQRRGAARRFPPRASAAQR
ncbi:MAG: hypothetical protein NVV73_01305 [Cellvibrionaceae bacterium]|nr:hypothetical protein [Cellvibrionaceae bacterium]